MGDVGWESKLLEAVDAHAGEVAELATEVARASREPDVSGVAARYLERCGLFPFSHDAGGGRRNLLARYTPGSVWGGDVSGHGTPGRHLVLCGYSRIGAAGDAARLAAALWATGLVTRLGLPLAGPLTVLLVGDDREGDRGVPWVLDRDLIEQPTAALIAGPSDRTDPGIGQLGRCQFEIRLTASDAREAPVRDPADEHPPSGRKSEQMESARESVIVSAAAAVLALRQLAGLRADVPRDVVEVADRSTRAARANGEGPSRGEARLDHVDVNIGTIHGGSAVDAPARHCVVGVDCGLPFGIDRSRVLERVAVLLADAGIPAEIVERGAGSLASLTPATEPVVRSLLGAVRDLVDPRAYGIIHRTAGDARWFREYHIPAAQYGPGDGEGRDAASVYALTILRYLRTSDRG